LIPTADGRRSSSPPKPTRVRCAAAVIGSSMGAWHGHVEALRPVCTNSKTEPIV
jgi:hypothetical protein